MAQSPETSGIPVVGYDIDWTKFEKVFCRVEHFTPLGTIEGAKVRGSRGAPYALLMVDSPWLAERSLMPVGHREDFRNLWDIFEQRGVGEGEEVLLSYTPFFRDEFKWLRFLRPWLPRLYAAIYPRGHLEEVYAEGDRPKDSLAWIEPIAEWHPKRWRS